MKPLRIVVRQSVGRLSGADDFCAPVRMSALESRPTPKHALLPALLALLAFSALGFAPPAFAQAPASPSGVPAQPSPISVQAMIDAAAPGSVVEFPKGNCPDPLTISKPLTLRGESADVCEMNVIADAPAITIKGARGVVLENITIRWSTKSPPGTPILHDAAVAVLDGEATLKGCRLAPINNPTTTPCGLLVGDKAEAAFIDGLARGFDYTINFTEGSKGSVEGSALNGAGHSVVLVRPGASAKIAGNILAKCGYHAVRVMGGTIEMTGNLAIDNARAGVYLGNQAGHGAIRGNLFLRNGGAVWARAESDAAIEGNVMAQSRDEAISLAPESKLAIRRNIIGDNTIGVKVELAPGAAAATPLGKLEGNLYWGNRRHAMGLAAESEPVMVPTIFMGYTEGDFELDRAKLPDEWKKTDAGLADPAAIKRLWLWSSSGRKPTPEPTPTPAATPKPAGKKSSGKKPAKSGAKKK